MKFLMHHGFLTLLIVLSLPSTPLAAGLQQMPGKTLLFTGMADAERKTRLTKTGVEVVTLPLKDERLDLSAVLQYLGTLEINEVHLEAGATLCGALLQAGLIDELVIYVAPVLMGDSARALFRLPGLETMEQKIELDIIDRRMVGQDMRITAKVIRK